MSRSRVQESAGFVFLMRDVFRLVRKRFEKRAVGLGLTQGQWSTLSHLARHEGVNQSTLAEIMEVEPIVLVGLLDRLEEGGWVERRPDPADRRARLLFLRREAQPLLEKIRALKTRVRREAFIGISAEEQKRLMQTLAKVKRNLSAT